MKPSKLKAHFVACYSNLAGQELDYFNRKETSLKANLIDSTGRCAHQNEAALEVSYRIALRIARTKKPHNIGEELIKPCILEASKLILGEQQANKLQAISLSNDTDRSRISEMSEDIFLQVVTAVKHRPVYSLQLDESTDVASCSQLLVYVRYLNSEIMKEEYLFS